MLCVGTVGSRVSAPPAAELVERHRPAVIAHADGWWYVSCLLQSAISLRHEHEAPGRSGSIYTWVQVGGFVLIALSAWVAFMAYKERRRWLLTWSSVYFATSVFMTLLTYIKGPDPHDMFGCR